MRTNLVGCLRDGRHPVPGIVGLDDTVKPNLERALLAGHDLVLLGERGQGRTRPRRTLVGGPDNWQPYVAGTETFDDPYAPAAWSGCGWRRARDDLAIAWRHHDERHGEKVATPDPSVGELVGDVDPVRVSEAARSAILDRPGQAPLTPASRPRVA